MSVRRQNGWCDEYSRNKNELDVPAETVVAVSLDDEAEVDVDYQKKIKYGNRFQAAWALIVEFCSNSSVHGVRSFTERKRHCYFDSERRLRFFKVYTQRNCELECLSNFTMSLCGCVKFSLPRDNVTPICGAAKVGCYYEAEETLLEKLFVEGLSNSEAKSGNESCNCLPACTSITYDAEISQAEFDWDSYKNAFEIPVDEFPGMQLAHLSIYFKEHQFITSKRSELYGPTDFLANCGGLLSLFMGVSVLSILECIFYFTLRLGCLLRLRRHRKRKSMRLQKNAVAPAEEDIPAIMVVKPGEIKETKDHSN